MIFFVTCFVFVLALIDVHQKVNDTVHRRVNILEQQEANQGRHGVEAKVGVEASVVYREGEEPKHAQHVDLGGTKDLQGVVHGPVTQLVSYPGQDVSRIYSAYNLCDLPRTAQISSVSECSSRVSKRTICLFLPKP